MTENSPDEETNNNEPWTLVESKQRIDHCYEKVHFNSDGDESSRGEGPSKGKDVDPNNWGALKFGSSGLDVNAQREAMKAWNMESKTGKGKSPHQKNYKHKTRIEIVTDEDAPKASAHAAAKENPSKTKFTLMSDALMNRVANAVKGHRRPNIHQE
ncbi:hypothetical protein L208DRAFT_1397654 [Tricholoma matsutake]|nr:hypothetical protein L208DRAFT_1397654 [Tricholoma matsutake 945]